MSDRPRHCVGSETHQRPQQKNAWQPAITRFRYCVRTGSLIALLMVVGFLGAVASLAQSQEWKPFGAANEGFRVLFPTAPDVSRNTIPAGSETYELRSYVSQVGQVTLYAGVCDYGVRGRTTDPATLLNSAKEGAVTHVKAHTLSEKKVELASSPGVAFEAESDKLHFSVRMIFSEGLLYQLMVTAPLDQKYADTDRFFDSFQLVPRAVGAGISKGASDWKPYRYDTDGFSVNFPADPAAQKQNIPTDAGQFELHTYTAQDSSSALIAAVCDYGTSVGGKDPQTLLKGSENGALEKLRAHLVSSKKISLGDAQGEEFEAESDSQHISERIYVRGSSLYQLLVVSSIHTTYADTTRFFDSFQLRDKEAK